jgi:sensor histidine kinase YesM
MGTTKIHWRKIAKGLPLHLLFWALVVTYFAWGFGFDVDPKKSFQGALFYLPGHLIMVYSLLYFLVPKFLLKRKFLKFGVGFLLVLFLCSLYTVVAKLSLNNDPAMGGATPTVGRNILPFIHVGAIAASVNLLKHWYLQRKQTLEAEQQRTVAELQLLKAQLHPHFLFNTLNNLYSHTLEFSPRSPEIVLKLSGLLRFMIYESNVTRVPLAREIELMQDYITLEQLRYGDRLDISVTISGAIQNYQIAPLMLLPFLENAFKHGTSRQIDQCWINFDLILKGDEMHFKLVNSIEPDWELRDEGQESRGIGLRNVHKRLALLYADKHRLETLKLEEVFVVNLELQLEPLERPYENSLLSSQKGETYAM